VTYCTHIDHKHGHIHKALHMLMTMDLANRTKLWH